MSEPIQAGTLNGIDLETIRDRFPSVCEELARLGSLLDSGQDSDDDFIRLCKLLIHVGERGKARELLLANCDFGDPAEKLFQSEFPDSAKEYEESINVFSKQFSCNLKEVRRARHLSKVYFCRMNAIQENGRFTKILSDPAGSELHVTDDLDGSVFADLYPVSNPMEAVPLKFDGNVWLIDNVETK